jgi:hypothetical protein
MVGYAYATEFFTAWYSGNPYELFTFLNRALGPYAWAYWIMITCNVISPQLFWSKKARTSIPILFVVSIVINIGMWFERFVIIVTSLHRDFLPSSWGYFSPTMWDVMCLLGSFGLFFTMFCLFVRFLPMVATAEVKTVLPQADPHWHPDSEHPAAAPAHVVEAHADPVPAAPLRGDSARGWTFQMPLIPRLPKGPHYGILAEFSTPAALHRACERVRDAGFTRWDAHTPFPVHGLSRAMGLRRSALPWIVLAMGLTGVVAGFTLQWWVHTVASPLVISGKPFFTWPAFIPVTFEVAILFGALGAVFGMFALNRLPMHHHPLFQSRVFERASDDTFFISIESWDPRFDAAATGKLLESLGARSVELLES